MVLNRFDATSERPLVYLTNPRDEEGDRVALDLVRFEEAWSGDLVIVKRNYDLADEEQPFSFNLIAGLVFRERRMVRDLVISALFLGLFALAPIIYWRLLGDKVIYYSAMNTLAVLAGPWPSSSRSRRRLASTGNILLNVIVARVDARLNEYIYDRLLRLPIDFFERTQIGEVAHDMMEVYKIREFLTGQLFGTVLDSMMLLFFLPVMIAFSRVDDIGRNGVLHPHRALAPRHAARAATGDQPSHPGSDRARIHSSTRRSPACVR